MKFASRLIPISMVYWSVLPSSAQDANDESTPLKILPSYEVRSLLLSNDGERYSFRLPVVWYGENDTFVLSEVHSYERVPQPAGSGKLGGTAASTALVLHARKWWLVKGGKDYPDDSNLVTILGSLSLDHLASLAGDQVRDADERKHVTRVRVGIRTIDRVTGVEKVFKLDVDLTK
jgi:hypothetical protein